MPAFHHTATATDTDTDASAAAVAAAGDADQIDEQRRPSKQYQQPRKRVQKQRPMLDSFEQRRPTPLQLENRFGHEIRVQSLADEFGVVNAAANDRPHARKQQQQHQVGEQRQQSAALPAISADVLEQLAAQQAVPSAKVQSSEPFLLETLFESLKCKLMQEASVCCCCLITNACRAVEPQTPQLLLTLGSGKGLRKDDGRSGGDDALLGGESSFSSQEPRSPDEMADEVLARAAGPRLDQTSDGDLISWQRDWQRWQPMAKQSSSPLLSQSLLPDDVDIGDVISQMEARGKIADEGLADGYDVRQDWVGPTDMLSSDDQDYDLRLPVLKSLLSEKRVDVKKPGPHFDRLVSCEMPPPPVMLFQLLLYNLRDSFYRLPRIPC